MTSTPDHRSPEQNPWPLEHSHSVDHCDCCDLLRRLRPATRSNVLFTQWAGPLVCRECYERKKN